MTEQALVKAAEQNLSLVALSPSEMPATQAALGEWCLQKCAELKRELADLEEHALIAAGNGWKLRGLNASISRTEKRIVYYSKMKDAVDAGFLMVPNFPVTLLAVRVKSAKMRTTESEYSISSRFDAKPELLPTGEGGYVDERVFHSNESYDTPDGKGGTKHVTRYVSGEYDAPDFPFAMVKPAVLQRTQEAMARRIFDTIGMVENRSGRDPIMVGQLLDPRGNDRRVTFFLAWWLNTRDL